MPANDQANRVGPRLAGPALLLLASGTAGLVFQVVWIKQLALVVGVDVHAVAVGVSAFFAGLALGGWAFGGVADRVARPLALYARLEVGVALLAVAATLGLGLAPGPFARAQDAAGPLAWLIPIVLVGIPATLMGGTLPVLIQAMRPALARTGSTGGALYAANTAGAILGCLLAAFVLIPLLGLRGSTLAAAALNLLAAGGALLLLRREAAMPDAGTAPVIDRPLADGGDAMSPSKVRLALVLYAVAGGIALGYEVVWSQSIVQFLSTRSFAFAVVLATYLLGLAVGSACLARRVDRLRDPWGTLAWLIAAAGAVALIEVALLGEWLMRSQSVVERWVLGLTGQQLLAMCARFALAAACIVFVPTVLLGAAFPVALRLASGSGHAGRELGRVVALNTVGGIAGTLLAGFVLVPWLGLVHTLGVLAVAAGLLGLVAVLAGPASRPAVRWGVAVLCGLVVAGAALVPSDRLASLLTQARGGELRFYEESRGGTVAVVRQNQGSNRFNRLYIQGVSNSGDAMTSLRYMRLQALLPLIVHNQEPKSALVIGMGTGITAGSLLAWPGLQERVVAELLPAVVRAAPQFKGNYGLTQDARMQIRVRDGRRELLASPQRYDLITLEPPPPSAAGVVNLYSSDFYQLAASRLQAGGLVAQWLPLPTQNDEDTRSLVRSFIDVFPHATVWSTEFHEMMLVGSMQPIVLDVERIQSRFAQPQVSKALAEVGVDSAAALMATWVGDRATLERYAAGAQPVTDDRPRIEYATWVRRADFGVSLTSLLDLRTEPPLQGADKAFIDKMTWERRVLYRFYSSGMNAYQGDRKAWLEDIREVVRVDPDNPYYRWFTGGSAR
ncbi:fused MFS/spermidine synthase [Variovorax dokdonensis]|uniref:Fused MFS/spermidine synthase n=1 Tax=Variovorax dokdonensis TaxID=344883 RepID=A0ABT7NGZ1_9BURK|nr:fused MFS/spermidine synthase [Variovorax dokdonensis]MDM0047204.1 fused MFS/spermidine synthase [Variovorax dokdonensis]